MRITFYRTLYTAMPHQSRALRHTLVLNPTGIHVAITIRHLTRPTLTFADGLLHPSIGDLTQENDWVSAHIDNTIVVTTTVVIMTVPVMTDGSRIFPPAQTQRRSQFVPSALGVMPTVYSTAMHSKPGMELTGQSPKESKESYSFAAPALLSASNGNGPEVAPATNTMPNTSAPVAIRLRTELKGVLDHRKTNALTPYHPEAWYNALQKAGIYEGYAYIISGLRHGFVIGLPNISSTQAPPNRESITEFKEEFARIVEHEIVKGRYIGPISYQDLEALVGPFQSSPFSIIPKTGKVGKYRNVQNYSFPIYPSPYFPNWSINSLVDSDSFPTTWGTFSLVSLLIHCLPPGSQLATRDVAEAYRKSIHSGTPPCSLILCDAKVADFAAKRRLSEAAKPTQGQNPLS